MSPNIPIDPYAPSGPEQSEADWLADLHGGDDYLQQLAGELRDAYAALGSPYPLEHGHWLALARAIFPD